MAPGSLSVDLHELCCESTLLVIRQRFGIGSVPLPLTPLNEPLALALDVLRQMRCQRLKVSTQLSLCSLPIGKGSLRSDGCGDVGRGWVGMTVLRILLDLSECSLLGCRVLFQPRGMVEQIGFASLIPVFVPPLGERSPFAWMNQHR